MRKTQEPWGRVLRSLFGKMNLILQAALMLEIRDQNLAVAAPCNLLGGIGKFYFLDVEAAEQGADFGHVVQREHELAAQGSEPFRQLLKISRLEVVAVE